VKEWSLATSVLSKSVLRKRVKHRHSRGLQAQPDADKTLKLILSRLDDMKAEEETAPSISWQIRLSDYMVVTSGRATGTSGPLRKTSRKV